MQHCFLSSLYINKAAFSQFYKKICFFFGNSFFVFPWETLLFEWQSKNNFPQIGCTKFSNLKCPTRENKEKLSKRQKCPLRVDDFLSTNEQGRKNINVLFSNRQVYSRELCDY